VLELPVLGLLKEQDMHGYELKKRLSDVFGVSSAVSFGSLYPALARLEAAGAVREVAPAKGGRPSATALDGSERLASRRRKVYGLTSLGAKMFEELLANSHGPADDERLFPLRLAFARYLPPESRLGLLEQRRAVLGERLAQMSRRGRARRDDRYMRILAARRQEELVRDVSWLDLLIEQERVGAGAGAGAGAGDRTASAPSPLNTRAWPRLVPLASASQLQRVTAVARTLIRPAEPATPGHRPAVPQKEGL
jgi:DNA-binding PadR family transcriptional regulator